MTQTIPVLEGTSRLDPAHQPLPEWAPPVAGAVAVVPGVLAVVWVAAHVRTDPALHQAALFVHLACLVVGFGAVLAVDWVALMWVWRRRGLSEVLTTAAHLQVPIWLGYAGLVVSGAFLEPDPGASLTLVKLGAVVVIGWNGCLAAWLHRRLSAYRGPVGRGVLALSVASASISQAGWWGATLIGFLATR